MSRRTGSTILGVAMLAITACSEGRAVSPHDPGTSGIPGELVLPLSIGWQAQARALVAEANMSPLAAARTIAALGVAQYRAVVAIDDVDDDGTVKARGLGTGGRNAIEGRRGAVAGASAQVLSFFFPAAAAMLDQRVQSEGSATPGQEHPNFRRGVAIGRAAGLAMVEQVKGDRFTTPWTGTVPTGPGMWIASGPPAGATFGGVTPYFMVSGSQFRPPPPPAFGSASFNTDLAEIATLAANRTEAQIASAVYWNFPTGTHTPVGYWNAVAGDYIGAGAMDERDATRTFALTNAALMDALIGCWDAKYHYWTLRPSQANPKITLTFGLPNHPSYPSGHSCASAAAATVLTSIFPARATELQGWVSDAGLSRMYAGIHYRFDITPGQDLGRAVGRWALEHEERLIARP